MGIIGHQITVASTWLRICVPSKPPRALSRRSHCVQPSLNKPILRFSDSPILRFSELMCIRNSTNAIFSQHRCKTQACRYMLHTTTVDSVSIWTHFSNGNPLHPSSSMEWAKFKVPTLKQKYQKCPGIAHRSGRPAAQRHSCVGARWGRGLTEHDRSRTWRFARANQTCVGHLNDSWDISDISQISTFYSFDRFLRITLQIELKMCDLYDINKIKIWYIYIYIYIYPIDINPCSWLYRLFGTILKCGSCQTGSPCSLGVVGSWGIIKK